MPEIARSRRFIALSAIVLFLVLDAARSLIGHFGYAKPVSIWHPDPAVYADMTWPPASNVPADATPGQRIYIERCGFCHGPDGRGNGTSAPSMIPRPRDFTAGQFKYKSTPEGAPPSDDDLIKVVTDGLHASAMPYFRGVDLYLNWGAVKSRGRGIMTARHTVAASVRAVAEGAAST